MLKLIKIIITVIGTAAFLFLLICGIIWTIYYSWLGIATLGLSLSIGLMLLGLWRGPAPTGEPHLQPAWKRIKPLYLIGLLGMLFSCSGIVGAAFWAESVGLFKSTPVPTQVAAAAATVTVTTQPAQPTATTTQPAQPTAIITVPSATPAALPSAAATALPSATVTQAPTPLPTQTPLPSATPLSQLALELQQDLGQRQDLRGFQVEGNSVTITAELCSTDQKAAALHGLELLDLAALETYDFVYSVFTKHPAAQVITVAVQVNGDTVVTTRATREQAFKFPLEKMTLDPTVMNYMMVGTEQRMISQWEPVFARADIAKALSEPSQEDLTFLLGRWQTGDITSVNRVNGVLNVTVDYTGAYNSFMKLKTATPESSMTLINWGLKFDVVGSLFELYRSIPGLDQIAIHMVVNGQSLGDAHSSLTKYAALGGPQAFFHARDRSAEAEQLFAALK